MARAEPRCVLTGVGSLFAPVPSYAGVSAMIMAFHLTGRYIEASAMGRASEAIRRGMLVPVLTDYDWPLSPAYAVYPPTRHLSYRVRALIDFLAD